MYENELYHHGVLGMKWGVRRYQNADGSLTYAGKKRALKIQNKYTNFTENQKYRKKNGDYTYAGRKKSLKMREKYSAVTGGKKLTKFVPPSQPASSGKPKTLAEMSNKEIADKIDRIRLENTLKSLTPQKVSKGKKFADGMKSLAVSTLKGPATKIASEYIEKKLRSKLDLGDPNTKKKESEKLQQEMLDARNRYNIENFTKLYNDLKNKK